MTPEKEIGVQEGTTVPVKPIIIGDIDTDLSETMSSELTPILENVSSLDRAVDLKETELTKLKENLETGDKISYILEYYDDKDQFEEDMIETVEGMKLNYDDIPLITPEETYANRSIGVDDWEDRDLNLAQYRPNFNPKPEPGETLKPPFAIRKYVVLITDDQKMRVPFKVSVPEGYTGSIRTLIDQVARPGIFSYSLIKRERGSIIIERKVADGK